MPKASKRQKEKKADFQKTKLKLGKGKQVANNATDVSFKAKTIALPQQSINADKSGKLVNSRNLTTADLALQLRHYSAGVRRDAVAGIKEILTLHPSLMLTDAAPLVPELSRCIGDEDAAVRKQLHGLLVWMLPQIPAQLLGPYHNTLLLFTTSALSHIYPEVRLDAIKILDVCLDVLPHVATAGWENAVHKMANAISSAAHGATQSNTAGPSNASHQPHGERIMNCYLTLLGITQKSGSAASITATDLAPGAKLLIIRSLRSFLTYALRSTSRDNPDADDAQSCPTWFFRSAFASSAEYEYFRRVLTRHAAAERSRCISIRQSNGVDSETNVQLSTSKPYSDWPFIDQAATSLMDLTTSSGTSLSQSDLFTSLQTALALQPLSASNTSQSPSGKQTHSAALSLYTLLDPVLLATFLDTAPSAFQPDLDLSQQSRGQNVGLSAPAQLIFELISLVLALWRDSSSSAHTQGRTALANMLGHFSVYFPLSHRTGSSGLSAKAKSAVVQIDLAYAELAALLTLSNTKLQKVKSKFNAEVQIASVSSFIAELLSTPITESGTVSLASVGAPAASVLDPDTFRALLPTLWFLLGSEHDTLLDSLLASYHAHATQHRVKPVLFEFLARAFLLSKVRAETPFTTRESDRILESLLSMLPRSLWEASSSTAGHAFAAAQLEFLHVLLLLPSPPATLVCEKFGPFYWIRHPTKKVSGPGPFSKLPRTSRKLAIDLVSLLKGRDEKLDKAMSQALQFVQHQA